MSSSAPLLRKAQGDADRLLRYRPRSTQEMAHRLRLRGHPPAVIQTLITKLSASGALNDRQFAVLWARARAHALHGSRRIMQELGQRGVARPLIDETMGLLAREHDELAAARALVERRVRRAPATPRAVLWRRLSQQLARRGYPMHVIEDALQQCLPRHDET